MEKQEIKKISWSEISNKIEELNPELFRIITTDNKLIPKELSILSYHYGEQVGDEDFFYYPGINKRTTKRPPFCMVLENNFEMYMECNSRISPWKIYKPGNVFPYTKFLKNNYLYEPSNILKMTAGARNSFLLMNKFSDKRRHALLQKKYRITRCTPNSLEDQFFIFGDLSKAAQSPWRAKLLAFPEEWEKKVYELPIFLNYLHFVSYSDNIFKRNILLYDYIFNTLNLKYKTISNAFSKEVIRYLLFIACGDQPAYLPTLDESYAPINLIRELYVDVYKSDSVPIFMIPYKLIPFQSTETIYYSLNKNDFLFKPNQLSNMGKLTNEIKELFLIMSAHLRESKIANNTIFYKSAEIVDINLIHRWNHLKSKNDHNEILFFERDLHFIEQIKTYQSLEFPTNSLFLSGCFTITYKTQVNLQQNIEY